MTDTSVKYFNHSMTGSPVIDDQPGSFITFLDAILVNGFNEVTLETLTVSSGVATAYLSSGHGFEMMVNNEDVVFGHVVVISGSSVSEMNTEWRITSVPDANTFTFDCPELEDMTVSGTITVKYAPFGWTKPFSGTNIGVYRNNSLSGNGVYVRVDNTNMRAAVTLFSTMTDVDNGSGESGIKYWNHRYNFWSTWGDDRLFAFATGNVVSGSSFLVNTGLCGDLKDSGVVADFKNSLLIGWNSNANDYVTTPFVYPTTNNKPIILGDELGAEVPSEVNVYINNMCGSTVGYGIIPWDGTLSSLFLDHMYIVSNSVFRGHIPGFYNTWTKTVNIENIATTPFFFRDPDTEKIYGIFHAYYWAAAASVIVQLSDTWWD